MSNQEKVETQPTATSDVALLDLMRSQGPLKVSQLANFTGVTATAVRQRLNRLMENGLVERVAVRAGRGRPSHEYQLTEKGRRRTGSNFADLAIALWSEIRQIDDPEVRRGLLQRLANRLANIYADQVVGDTLAERMDSIRRLFSDRDVTFVVEADGLLPVLSTIECPYPGLAEQDRTICAFEKILFSQLLGQNVRLGACRLDGDRCCTFETN
jgi:predicted ArsR family transcriptional regulator